MPSPWTDTTVRYLLQTSMCPRCNATITIPGRCTSCNADLSGPDAVALVRASQAAASALQARQQRIDSLANLPPLVLAHGITPAPSALLSAGAEIAPPTSTVSVQSVLATAGAGLVGVAALVFTFFNPDLTNFATRTWIIAAFTALFVVAAWLLVRAKLQFSAEAVGALAGVFLVLDVWAFSNTAPSNPATWLFLGIGTAVSSVALLVLGTLLRLRTWTWTALVGLILVPPFLALAANQPWVTALGWVAAGVAAIGCHWIARRLQNRMQSEMRAERVTATIAQLVAVVLALAQVAAIGLDSFSGWALPAAGILALLSLAAAASAHTMLPRFWSFVAGGMFVTAAALLPLAWSLSVIWHLALPAVTAAGALALIAVVRPWLEIRVGQLRVGGVIVLLATAIPATVLALEQLSVAFAVYSPGTFAEERSTGPGAAVPPEQGLTVIVALTAVFLGTFAVSAVRRDPPGYGYRAIAGWFGMLALATVAGWSALPRIAQSGIAIALVVGLSLGVSRMPRLAAMRPSTRLPIIAGLHVLVIFAAAISWAEPAIRVPMGALLVIAILVLALAMPAPSRPVYLGVAYAWALVVFAAGMTLLGLAPLVVLCLTTTLASLAGLAATLTQRLGARPWYAVLIVTAVPFGLGIISVIIERSGWTALSTAVTFALLLALVLTRRDGMNQLLRTFSASLLVPSLGVVIVSLGAQVLIISASPVTLPVIAVIVAGALPMAGTISAFLVRHGIPLADAGAVRIAIEIGALVTGAIAVLLALVRSAAGIPTTFLVLLVLGIGGIATAVFGQRRYGWLLAGAAWTGALWCVWNLAGITLFEPYLLPPALGIALVGAFLTLRGIPGIGLSGVGLVWTGLAIAVLPTLVVLAIAGSAGYIGGPWRAVGILSGAVVLLALGAAVPRLQRIGFLHRAAPLRTPLLIAGGVAASAGSIQAIRYGLDIDRVDHISGPIVFIPVLIASLVSVVLAIVAGRLLQADAASDTASTARIARSRALYIPAVVYLVVGPIAAIRDGWFPIITLLALTVVVLALMIVTAVRGRGRVTSLPPVLFLWAVAWCTAVASWSQRELRVEAYSLPLGMALLVVGIVGMVPGSRDVDRPSLSSWPLGFSGSWRLLAPGLLATFVPSVLSTGTDPLTQRAILVIALALVAILIGNLRRLAAPFIIGIVVLPIENIVVFAVQLGRSIGALPWWITLATAGAVLLVIAVSSERSGAGDRGAMARLRDLT